MTRHSPKAQIKMQHGSPVEDKYEALGHHNNMEGLNDTEKHRMHSKMKRTTNVRLDEEEQAFILQRLLNDIAE